MLSDANYIIDTKTNIKKIGVALNNIIELCELYDKFDEYLSKLNISDLSNELERIFNLTLSFNDNGFDVSELDQFLNDKYDIIMQKVLINIISLDKAEFNSYLQHQILLYNFDSKSIVTDISDLDSLYNRSLYDDKSNDLLNNINDELAIRFEIFIKVLFYSVYNTFKFDQSVNENVDLNLNTLYSIIKKWNLVKYYIQLLEYSCSKYIPSPDIDDDNIDLHVELFSSDQNHLKLAHDDKIKDLNRYLSELHDKFDIKELNENYRNGLLSTLLHKSYSMLHGSCNTINGINILHALNTLDLFVKNAGITSDSTSLYDRYLNCIIDKWESNVLQLIRQCILGQGTVKLLFDVENVVFKSEYDIKIIDRNVICELLSTICDDPNVLLSKLNWIYKNDASYVSYHGYILCMVLYKLSLVPMTIMNGTESNYSDEIMTLYIKRNANIIKNSLMLFIILSPASFNEFVHSIPTLIIDFNYKLTLITFIIFVSNVYTIKNILLAIPYMMQDSLRSATISHIIKDEYKFSKLEASLLKLQHYFITHLIAFIQQCSQKTIHNDLNNNTIMITEWIKTYKSHIQNYLPNEISVWIVQLCDEFLFISIINFIDEIISHESAIDLLMKYDIYVETIITSPDIELSSDILEKMKIFAKVFANDYGILETNIVEPQIMNKINRLCKFIN